MGTNSETSFIEKKDKRFQKKQPKMKLENREKN